MGFRRSAVKSGRPDQPHRRSLIPQDSTSLTHRDDHHDEPGLGLHGAHPWLMLFPGLAIFLAVLGLSLLGDGLRDVLDPRVRR